MLQIIGAGLGRTGTHSLALALERLGFGRCYHVLELAKNPDHIDIWNRAVDGESVDWDALFQDYRAAVEWPAIACLPQLIQHYPQAKIILTLRDPEVWYESANTTIFNALELSRNNPNPEQKGQGALVRRMILDNMFSSRYRDKAYAIEVYQQHNRNVIEMTPAHRLLQYQVTEGWGPLCHFLEKPIPDEPFPRVNDRADFLSTAPDWAKQVKDSGSTTDQPDS